MPIVDVQLVQARDAARPVGLAGPIADALGSVFRAEPGRVWVRVATLDAELYAENHAELAGEALPVFVTVLHFRPPEGVERAAEAMAIARALGECLGHPVDRIHVEYALSGQGRIAFGGKLVT